MALRIEENLMTRKIAYLLCIAMLAVTGSAYADKPDEATQKAAARKTAELCSACHGPGGNSISPTFPRLAGQRQEYLENQLRALKTQKRGEPDAHDFMWGVAASLDDKMIGGLAYYYAAQPPARGIPGDPVLIARGKDLFEKGVPSKPLPACSTCHGMNGEGIGEFPRLAGQHAAYMVKQITVIQSLLRAAPVMHGIVKEMNRAEMEAVAAYLQSL
jgi:cytochrome c553